MKKELPRRKKNRLPHFDYSAYGTYFVTICIKDRVQMLWDVGARIARPPYTDYTLSRYGKMIEQSIGEIASVYPTVQVDCYVIMPNHIHLLLTIRSAAGGRAMRAPTISNVINQFKGCVTKRMGFSCWQKSFHDHIVRNEEEYQKIWQYIQNNPVNWESDCFYVEIKENDA